MLSECRLKDEEERIDKLEAEKGLILKRLKSRKNLRECRDGEIHFFVLRAKKYPMKKHFKLSVTGVYFQDF